MIRKPKAYIFMLITTSGLAGLWMHKSIYGISQPYNFMAFLAIMSATWFLTTRLLRLHRDAQSLYKVYCLLMGSFFVSFYYLVPEKLDIAFLLSSFTLLLVNHFIIQKYYKEPYHFYPKAAERHQVEIKAQAKSDLWNTVLEIKDISSSGLYARSVSSFEVGETLHVSVDSNNYQFRVKARVVRQDSLENAYGMVFVGLDQRYHASCEQAVSELLNSLGSSVNYKLTAA